MKFVNPQVILFVEDCERAATFYQQFGFEETFRTSTDSPVKVEMVLDGFGLGLALPGPAMESHGLDPISSGHRACITLWTENIDAAYAMALDVAGQDVDDGAAARAKDVRCRGSVSRMRSMACPESDTQGAYGHTVSPQTS